MHNMKKFYSIKPGESLEEIKRKRGISLCELLEELDVADSDSYESNRQNNQQLTFDNLSEDDRIAQNRLKKLRGALNKLAPDNFYIQLMEIQDYLPVHSSHLMQIFVRELVQKAIDEEQNSILYAHVCTALKSVELLEVEDETIFNFGAVVLDECFNMFCFARSSLNWFSYEQPSENELLELKTKEAMKKRRLVGVARFLGDLFKAGMTGVRDVFQYIKKLEQDVTDKSIEGLTVLLTVTGKELEIAVLETEFQADWCATWDRIFHLSQKEQGLPHRLRFMLMNLLDLRDGGWIPRIMSSRSSPLSFIEIIKENDQVKAKKPRLLWNNKITVITKEPIVVNTESEILKLLSLNDNAYKTICDWERANFVGRKTWFVYSITKAVLRYSIEGNSLNKTIFTQHVDLLKKYINSRQAELAAMYAVQSVVVTEMKNPKGLLEEVCDILHVTNTISYIAFLDWRENWSNCPVLEVAGRAEAQISLATFFIKLFWESIKPSSQYKSIVKELNSFDLEHFVSMSKLPPEIEKRIKMEEEREKSELQRKDRVDNVSQSYLTKTY
ncbi:uncharacterized protein LOC106661616 isoform X2 [Cimex lectularius]|uniref:MIF4G domain-containing protein n=1 Tax=Cimex lectularius TaxID=79782 RepID=A0A8I6TLW1_CIMLE|nr:uncharacterized protein LOC106661616 isoform X2 [Cimex lectularius]